MADLFPLAGLLDRAAEVFDLAGKLGRGFHQHHNERSQAGYADVGDWLPHAPTFEQFYASLAALGDVIPNPPDGFEAVADQLKIAARTARELRESHRANPGSFYSTFAHSFPDLNSVWHDGLHAVGAARKALPSADPLGYVDKPNQTTSKIDTTPTLADPPPHLIESAARQIPIVLANENADVHGEVSLVASVLAKRIQDAGHTLAAAHWSIHEAVQAGRLRPALVSIGIPSASHFINGTIQWIPPRGGTGTAYIYIPPGKPAPFDKFRVLATPELWMWWRTSAEPSDSKLSASEGGEKKAAASKTDKAIRPSKGKDSGRKGADLETIRNETELAASWARARETGVYKADFAKQNGMRPTDFEALLNRVGKRTKRANKRRTSRS